MPLKLTSELHEVRDLPWTRYMRRRLRDPDFMTFKHKTSNSWVAGSWYSRVGGLVIEYEIIGENPAKFTRENVRNIEWERSPKKLAWIKQIRGKLLSKHRKDMQDAQDQADYHVAIREFFRKRSNIHQRDNPLWAGI